jgi:hypothetical protein
VVLVVLVTAAEKRAAASLPSRGLLLEQLPRLVIIADGLMSTQSMLLAGVDDDVELVDDADDADAACIAAAATTLTAC